MPDTLYYATVAAVAAERVLELAVARRNVRSLMARGGLEFDRAGYRAMVAVHALFLAACAAEVRFLGRPWHKGLAVLMAAVLAGAMALRYWVVFTLGVRWSTRIVVVPGDRLIRRGPYRIMRHPNYLAVVLEFFALPMVHTAYLTALVFSAINLAVLRRRIANEESAMRAHCLPPAREEDGS
ncbi:MAG: isoprenylcysteine carboxyl methyltransferase family protein [Vicinamibacterales bacterium]